VKAFHSFAKSSLSSSQILNSDPAREPAALKNLRAGRAARPRRFDGGAVRDVALESLVESSWSGIVPNFVPMFSSGIAPMESSAARTVSDALPRKERHPAVSASSGVRSLGPEVPSRQRARRTNDPFAGIETNTARGRRVADLVRAYLTALGNPTEVERQADAIAAAELQVLAEEARAAALKQGGGDLDQVIRVQGAADRAIRKLGLDRKREPERQELDDWLREAERGSTP
jgi:hypothetical protein